MAIVVCADVAVYARGPARCTGGAGAIAFLLGPHAPLVFEPGLRAFHSRNVYDFYKPVSGTCTEYPVVNGSESIDEYMLAVRKCYLLYGEKYRRQNGNSKLASQNIFNLIKKFRALFERLLCSSLPFSLH
jgi:hydroxymethylglutaryl-CoA synthase